jgi:predicted nucleotidyltransferase
MMMTGGSFLEFWPPIMADDTRKRLEGYPRPDKILNAVASAFGEQRGRLVEKQGQNNTAKKVAIYLMKRYTRLDNKEIGQVFGGLHYSAVSKTAARPEKELSKDKGLAKLVDRLVSNVKPDTISVCDSAKVIKMRKIKAEDDPVLAAIKVRLNEALGDNVRQIILFGSRSSGNAERDSDYDILVLVQKRSGVLEDQVDRIAYEMLDRYGAVVTIFVDEMATFQREKSEPLFCNIRQEGSVL